MQNTINETKNIELVEESTEVVEKTKKEKKDDMKTNQSLINENLNRHEALEPESDMPENIADDHKEVELDLSLISDSTSILETVTFIQADDGDLFGDPDLYEELQNFIDSKGQSNSKEKNLTDGKNLLLRCIKQYNKSWNGIKGTYTHYAIQLGRLLLTLKELVKKWYTFRGQ